MHYRVHRASAAIMRNWTFLVAVACKHGAYWPPYTRPRTRCWILSLSAPVKSSWKLARWRRSSVAFWIAPVLGWETGLLDFTKAYAAFNWNCTKHFIIWSNILLTSHEEYLLKSTFIVALFFGCKLMISSTQTIYDKWSLLKIGWAHWTYIIYTLWPEQARILYSRNVWTLNCDQVSHKQMTWSQWHNQ